MADNMLAQISAIEQMKVPELKLQWQQLFGRQAPPYAQGTYLKQRLIHRVQELKFGNDPLIDKRLEAASKQKRGNPIKSKRRIKPMPGTKLIREYKGAELQVTVLAEGFEYQGRKYKSLTKLANEITGTWLSGPAFFGLTTKNKEAA